MKTYVIIDGKLVEATEVQIKEGKLDLCNEKGEVVRAASVELTEGLAVAGDADDSIKELTDTVKTLADSVSEFIKPAATVVVVEETASNEALPATDAEKLVAYEKMAARGFPLPASGATVVEDNDLLAKCCGEYDLKRQGMRLMSKKDHPYYQVSEEARVELVKYFCLLVRSSRRRPDFEAMTLFDKLYGGIKTVVGDSGNTFPIPDIVEAEILALARESSVILQWARIWDMGSEKKSIPAESSGTSVAWGNTTAEYEPGITEVDLSAEELSAYSVVKNMTLGDSVSDIVSWLAETLSEASGLELDNKSFNGVGTDDPFICSGLLSAACGYSVSLASGSTAFSNLGATKLSEMIAKLDGKRKMGARWWLHGETLHFIRDLKDDNGRPIFVDNLGGSVSPQLWGYPYTEVTNMPSTSASNTAFLVFGNLRNFAVGRRVATSTLDVDPFGLWTTNRTRFKMYQRYALAIGLPKAFTRMLTASE